MRDGKKKALKICWGCNKKEEKGQAPFRNCSKCVELKVLPSLFCSNECLRENWPRHKAWHKELTSSVDAVKCKFDAVNLTLNAGTEQDTCTNTTNGLYTKLCIEGNNLLLSMNFAEAKKKLRKAQKLDPRLPDAYGMLGSIYYMSRQFEENIKALEEGIERWAFVIVTGKYGDEDLCNVDIMGVPLKTKAAREEWAIKQFTLSVYKFLEQLASEHGRAHKKPSWYRRDAVLKRVTRFLVGALRDRCGDDQLFTVHILRIAMTWHGRVLAGSITNGVRKDTNMLVFSDIPKERTVEDLEEAAASFNAAATLEEEECDKTAETQHFSNMGDKKVCEQLVVIITGNAQRMKAEGSQKKSPFYEGCWVVVFGLTSPTGQSLNKKLGLVTNANRNQGRLAVQIDGFDEPKSLKTQNLMVIPMADKDVALISCLSDRSQWTCMQPTLERHLPQIHEL